MGVAPGSRRVTVELVVPDSFTDWDVEYGLQMFLEDYLKWRGSFGGLPWGLEKLSQIGFEVSSDPVVKETPPATAESEE